MASFNNRRSGPNVSQFLRELQAPTQPPSPEDHFLEDELAMFTNTQFNEWEQSRADFGAPLKVDTEEHTVAPSEVDAPSPAVVSGNIGVEFNMPDEFNSFDFGTFASPVQPFPESLGNLQPLQPNPNSAYQASGTQQNHYGVSSSQSSERRPSDASGPHRSLNFEEQSRMAAEEDKRRRNTAASARFRVKKKAREQALEKREKELSDEVTSMKNRITHLETENKWLRGLVMEKAGAGKDSKFDAKLSAFLKSMGRTSESDSEEDFSRKSKAAEAEKAK